MIIYIPLEVSVRELPGHLLLALVAASKGHQVLIASSVDLWLYKRLNLLKKGCYLLKNVNIPLHSERINNRFLKDGFDLYCQEQESSILNSNFRKFLKVRNITKNQTLPFKGVFCWGARDTSEYKDFFKIKKDIFFNTGSTRAELWKDKSLSLEVKSISQRHKPYILVVSNFSGSMGKKHWSEASLISRDLEHLESYEQEKVFIQSIQEDSSIAFSMILAVKYIANNWPEYDVIIRPHPTDCIKYWTNFFSHNKNIHIIGNSDSITPWISSASVVIQNGCTSAIESVIQKTPLISYGPDRIVNDHSIPNMLGVRALNIDEIDSSLKCALNDECYKNFQIESESIIQPMITLDENNAALRIVKIMENNSLNLKSIRIEYQDLLGIRLAKYLKREVDVIRNIFGTKKHNISENNFNISTITDEMELMSKELGLAMPKIKLVSKAGLLVG
mgnify:FL=1